MTSQTSLLPAPVFSILILVALLMLPLTRAAEHSVPTDTWIPGWLVVVAALGALLVAALAAVVIGLRLCRLLLSPLDRVRLLGEVGYVEDDGRQPLKDVVELVRRRRCVGDVPPVYPNGWFALVESRCLGVGEVKNVFCVGKNLAVFRGEDGRAHALDAYCCHNGANLAVGGLVKGSCVECPFHGWLFRGDDGKCTHIPYCERSAIPETAKVTSYVTLERNGFVFLWYHAEGIDPVWEPPEIEEVAGGQWKYCGRSEHFVNAHIQELHETRADIAHLVQVHGPFKLAGVDLRYTRRRCWSVARHEWMSHWNQDGNRDHVGVINACHRLFLLGRHINSFDCTVHAKQIGPGLSVMTFNSRLFGRAKILSGIVAVEPLRQRLIHHVYSPRWQPTFIAKFILYSLAVELERDLMIWNNKRYVSRPLYVKSKEDSLIQRHRRWYSQFYSEHSPTIKAVPVTDTLDW